MIDHVTAKVNDIERGKSFYAKALAPLGYKVLMEVPTEFTGGVVVLGFGVPPKPDFWLHQGPPQKLLPARIGQHDDLRCEGDFPHTSGRRDAYGPPGRLPAVQRL